MFVIAAKRRGVNNGRVAITLSTGNGEFIQSAGMVKISSIFLRQQITMNTNQNLVGHEDFNTKLGSQKSQNSKNRLVLKYKVMSIKIYHKQPM